MRWMHAIVATAAAEVVSVADAKRDLDVTFAQDDELIGAYVKSAVDWVQKHTGRFLVPTTIDVYGDAFSTPLSLPFAPFQSFTTLSAGGSNITPRVVPGDFATLLPPSGQPWPAITQEIGSLVARYVVGYSAGTVPPALLQAVKLITSIFYDKPDGRELEASWVAVRNLLSDYRVRNI